MNCAQARFLLYAYLDRELSSCEAEALSRHVAECGRCQERARSARGLATVLRCRLDRAPAPMRLRARLQRGAPSPAPPRYPVFLMAAAVLFLVLPLVATMPAPRREPAPAALASLVRLPSRAAALVSREMTGTIVCLDCEARHEAGLCPLPEARHEAGFCAENGEVWRLMSRDPTFLRESEGQTVTVEGVAFPRSGFLRASRVGY